MKRLKLRKEVKVITTLLSFGLLCTAVPTINAVAEDTGTEENTVETNTVDETTTDETVIDDDDAVVEEQVVEEDDSPESDLYTRLMNTTTVEEFEAVANSATDEELNLLSDEQNSDISEHFIMISDDVKTNDAYAGNIIYTTVNFTNVAPLIDTTSGNN